MATDNPTVTPIGKSSYEENCHEVRELLADIRMVGDLLGVASNSPDQLLDDTPGHAGWFIERAAAKLQQLLNRGAA